MGTPRPDPTGLFDGPNGSFWPPFAARYVAATQVSVGIINIAYDGTNLSEWIGPSNNLQGTMAALTWGGHRRRS